MDGARGGVLQYIKSSVVQWKDMRPWQPEFGPEENILFLEISQGFPVYVGRISDAMGGTRGSFRLRRSYTPLAARVWA
jgi:hypothetical protein